MIKYLWCKIRNRCIICNARKSKFDEKDMYTWWNKYCRDCQKRMIHARLYGAKND